MGESCEPNWAISTPGNSMYIEVQHENSMRFMPHEMYMIKSALNKICNGVDIPESKIKLGEAEKQYQLLLNKVSEFHGWQLVVIANWNYFLNKIDEFDDWHLCVQENSRSGDLYEDDLYEYLHYVNPIIDLILQKADFEVLKSYVIDVCANTIGVLPSDEPVNDFVSNLVKLQKKITIPRGKHAK